MMFAESAKKGLALLVALVMLAGCLDAPVWAEAAPQPIEAAVDYAPSTLTHSDLAAERLSAPLQAPVVAKAAAQSDAKPDAEPEKVPDAKPEVTFISSEPLSIIRVLGMPNHVPVLEAGFDSSRETDQGEMLTIDLDGAVTDEDDDPIEYSVSAVPGHGSASIDSAVLTYTPDAAYRGDDSLTISSTDGKSDPVSIVITITVRPVNHPPVVHRQTNAETIAEDEPAKFNLATIVTDPDGDPLRFKYGKTEISGDITLPGGKFSIDGNTLAFTPKRYFFGAVEFKIAVVDESECEPDSSAQDIGFRVTVTPVNHAPWFVFDDENMVDDQIEFTGSEDQPLIIGFEVDDDKTDSAAIMLQQLVKTNPGLFSAVEIQPVNDAKPRQRQIKLTPAPNKNGSAKMELTITDGSFRPKQEITIGIAPVNDPPAAADVTFGFPEHAAGVTHQAGEILAHAGDPDLHDAPCVERLRILKSDIDYTPDARKGSLTFAFETIDEKDELTGFTFVPTHYFDGELVFEYAVTDQTGEKSAKKKVTIKAVPVNDSPVVTQVSCSDSDVTLTEITANERYSVVFGEDRSAGPIRFDFSDPETGNAGLLVTASASNPSIVNDAGLMLNKTAGAGYGTLSIVPLPDQNGALTVTLTISDGEQEAAVVFDVTVEPMEDAPVALDDAFTVEAGVPTKLHPLDNDYDVDGDALTPAIKTGPAHGTASVNPDGTMTYTADPGYYGADTITYMANDGKADSHTATIAIAVNPRDLGPQLGQAADVELAVWREDKAPEEVALNISGVLMAKGYVLSASAGEGTLVTGLQVSPASGTCADGKPFSAALRFKLVPDAEGTAVVTVTVTSDGKSDAMSFRVLVYEKNEKPVAKAYEKTLTMGETSVFPVVTDAADDDKTGLKIQRLRCINGAALGTMTIDDDKLRYNSSMSARGPWTAEYEYVLVDKGGLASDVVTQGAEKRGYIRMTITPKDRPPVARRDVYVLPYDDWDNYTLSPNPLANDEDPDMGDISTIQFEKLTVETDYGWMEVEDGANAYLPDGPGLYLFHYICSTKHDGVRTESNEGEIWIFIEDSTNKAPLLALDESYWVREDEHDADALHVDLNALIKGDPRLGLLAFAEGTPSNTAANAENGISPSDPIAMFAHGPAEGVKDEQYWFDLKTLPDMNGDVEISYGADNGVGSANYVGKTGGASTGKLTVHIEPVNDSPVAHGIFKDESTAGIAVDDPTQGVIGQPIVAYAYISDIDNLDENLIISANSSSDLVIGSSSIGLAKVGTHLWKLTLTPERAGATTISVSASDGYLESDVMRFRVVVPQAAMEFGPAVSELGGEIAEDTFYAVSVNTTASNPHGLNATIVIDSVDEGDMIGGDGGGRCEVVGKKIVYAPAANAFHRETDGMVTITYHLEAEAIRSDAGTIKIHVYPQNDKPEILNLLPIHIAPEDGPDGDGRYAVAFDVNDPDLGYLWDGASVGKNDNALVFGAELDDDSDPRVEAVDVTSVQTGVSYKVTLTLHLKKDASHGENQNTTISVTASNGMDKTSNASFDLHITPVNDGPYPNPANQEAPTEKLDGLWLIEREIPEDHTHSENFAALFKDVENDPLSIVRVAPYPACLHAGETLSVSDSKAHYKPPVNFCTQDSTADAQHCWYLVTVSDSHGAQAECVVKLNVTPVNDAPTVKNIIKNVAENTNDADGILQIDLTQDVHDVDNLFDELTIAFAPADPATAEPAKVRIFDYDPATGLLTFQTVKYWNGTVTVHYKATDPGDLFHEGTITIHVTPVNNPPIVAFDDGTAGWENNESQGAVTWMLNEDTAFGDAPNPFRFRVWDPDRAGAVGLLMEYEVLSVDGQTPAVTAARLLPKDANHIQYGGEGENKTFRFQPTADHFGIVQIRVTLDDGVNPAVHQTVSVQINPLNDPVAMADEARTIDEDAGIADDSIQGSDPKFGETAHDKLRYKITQAPQHGVAALIGAAPQADGKQHWSYTPDADFFGTDAFKITVWDAGLGQTPVDVDNPPMDGSVSSREATVTIAVNPVNDPPYKPAEVALNAIRYSHAVEATNQVVLSFSSPDPWDRPGETGRADISYEIECCIDGGTNWIAAAGALVAPSEGNGWAGSLRFTAPAGNSDNFSVRIRAVDDGKADGSKSDAGAQLKSGDVTLTAKLDSAAPLASSEVAPSDWINMYSDPQTAIITLTATDQVGTLPGATGIATMPAPAGATPGTSSGNKYPYTVSSFGPFTFTVTDNVGNVAAEGPITVRFDRLPPILSGVPSGIVPAGNDMEHPIRLALSADDQQQTASDLMSGMNGGVRCYVTQNTTRPPVMAWENYSAPIELNQQGTWYVFAEAQDMAGNVMITRFGPYSIGNQPPRFDHALADKTTPEDTPIIIAVPVKDDRSVAYLSLSASADDGGALLRTFNVAEDIDNGQFLLTITPMADKYGDALITLVLEDGDGGEVDATFTLYVTPVNDPPTTGNRTGSVYAGGAYSDTIPASDAMDLPDYAAGSFSFECIGSNLPRHGTLSLNGTTGAFTYTPDAGYVGQDAFYVKVSEGAGYPVNVMPGALPAGTEDAGDNKFAVWATVVVAVTNPPQIQPPPTPEATPAPTPTPEPTAMPKPTSTVKPAASPKPTSTPGSTGTHTPAPMPLGRQPGLSIPTGGTTGDGDGLEGIVPVADVPAFRWLDGVDLDKLGIAADAMAAIACTNGLTIENVNQLLTRIWNGELTYEYTVRELDETLDMPFQMLLPIELEQTDWDSLPEQRLRLPLIAKGECLIGHVGIRRETIRNEKNEEQRGYTFELDMQPFVAYDARYAAVHVAKSPQQVRMIEAQRMAERDFETQQIWHVGAFIPEQALTGALMLYVAVPCVFAPSQQTQYQRDQERLQQETDQTQTRIENEKTGLTRGAALGEWIFR